MELKFDVSPYIKSGKTVRGVMTDVIIALLPVIMFFFWLYGLRAFILVSVCVLSCSLTDVLIKKLLKRGNSYFDMSSVVTGLILALCLSSSVPLGLAAIGGVFAIAAGKEVFGGLGRNIFNPALTGRVFLQVFWPGQVSTWMESFDSVFAVNSSAGIFVPGNMSLLAQDPAWSYGIGLKILVLAGGIYLLARKQIKIHIPAGYILSAMLMAALFEKIPMVTVLTASLMLGAFFIATDPVTSPVTDAGKVIFGAGCGVITMLTGVKSFMFMGICLSVLAMNLLSPLIDMLAVRRIFGR